MTAWILQSFCDYVTVGCFVFIAIAINNFAKLKNERKYACALILYTSSIHCYDIHVYRMLVATEIDRKRNRELMKKLIWSLYFLVKHRIPHTTTFEQMITLQIDNGSNKLEEHRLTCPSNASYLSKATTSELLYSISHCIEAHILSSLRCSHYIG